MDCHGFTLCAVKEPQKGRRLYHISNLSADPATHFTVNGTPVDCALQMYDSLVLEERDGVISTIS